jgi:hypothetical protein
MADGMPPWVRYFLVHVLKRICCTLLSWIEEVQKAERSVDRPK